MEKRFRNLWERINGKQDPKEVFGYLDSLYSQEGRHYHTLTHIDQCLKELKHAKSIAEDFDALEFALWYHDVIYDTQRNDNEEESANLASKVCRTNELAELFSSKVYSLILGTAGHITSDDVDAQLMLDVDLSIFGQDENTFRTYERQIRQEYIWVPERTYNQKRSEILQGFLDRKLIYQTDLFQGRYEGLARRNLKDSIERLMKT